MNKSVYSLLTAAVLVGAGAVPAHAAGDGDKGTASAAVLRAKLDVSLLNKSATVPLHTELNAVQAPGNAEKTALDARLDGVHHGRPFTVLRAKAATARATADEHRSEGYSNVVRAAVHVPGLPLLPLVKIEQATSKAVCEAGRQPVAESNVLGTVQVLGKKVALSAEGTTTVEAEGIGTVELTLSKREVTSSTAVAAALDLLVSVDPGKLGVAEVEGRVTLVEATCQTPGGTGGTGGTGGQDDGGTSDGGKDGGKDGGQADGGTSDGGKDGGQADGGTSDGGKDGGRTDGGTSDGGKDGSKGTDPQTGSDGSDPVKRDGKTDQPSGDLAQTGSSSSTPYIAGGAAALLAAGGALVFLRRRRTA
ncbi:MAG TPA: SCO1860 family LAETG-anchored protein [Streptomyces sp.]|nr:SCO1860 family LAETG-anchored protein [Streptomyces sp.]